MHIHFLDPYRAGVSVIHHLDPRVKLTLTLGFILTTSLTPVGAWAIYILLVALALSVAILSDLGIGFVLKRASLAFPFVLAALPILFTTRGTVLFSLPFFWNLMITAEGLERFVSLALKSWVSVQMAIVLASTTPFPDLLVAMRALKIPRLLIAIFGLMWRYIFVLGDEALRLMRARAARSGSTDPRARGVGGGVMWRARVTGGMAGSLFLRAFERGDRIYMAMAARGYDGEVRAFPPPPLPTPQRMILLIGLVILVLLVGVGNLVWG